MSQHSSRELRAASATGTSVGNNLLLVLVFTTVFLVPLFPSSYHWLLYNVTYTGIYILAAMAMQKYRRPILWLAVSMVALEWTSDMLDLPLLVSVARIANVLFFILIVSLLIRQIASSKRVSGRLIVEAINGYLLLGLIFALLVILVGTLQPGAYSFAGPGDTALVDEMGFSDCFYYAFVTVSTVGYGDLLPLTPLSKSLGSMMGLAGQLYLAVILAMLVGKLSSAKRREVRE